MSVLISLTMHLKFSQTEKKTQKWIQIFLNPQGVFFCFFFSFLVKFFFFFLEIARNPGFTTGRSISILIFKILYFRSFQHTSETYDKVTNERRQISEKLQKEIEEMSKLDVTKVCFLTTNRKGSFTPSGGWGATKAKKSFFSLSDFFSSFYLCFLCLRSVWMEPKTWLWKKVNIKFNVGKKVIQESFWNLYLSEFHYYANRVFVMMCILQINFEQTLKVLEKGIMAFESLRQKWAKLVQFFQMTSNLIEMCSKESVDTFLEYSKKAQNKRYLVVAMNHSTPLCQSSDVSSEENASQVISVFECIIKKKHVFLNF